MRATALVPTFMVLLGMAGPAMAETYDASSGGSTAPNSGGEATASGTSAEASAAASGGAEYGRTTGRTSSTARFPVVRGVRARLLPSGRAAAPSTAPAEVQRAVWAANEIVGKPYVYGGGHNMQFKSSGYDCSGTVSYALHGGRASWLRAPLDSGSFMRWGAQGAGSWITVFTNPGHAYVVIAGLRLDTSAAGDPSGAKGPRWRPVLRSTSGFVARHPTGY